MNDRLCEGTLHVSGNYSQQYIQKRNTSTGDSFTFSYNERNIYPDDRGDGNDSDFVTVTHVMIPRTIESVINMGANTITIDGNIFETGRWELSQHGGISVDQAKGNIVITGTAPNALIEFRS